MSAASVGTAVFDEPRQRGAIALEIVAHAIQPFDLRRARPALPSASEASTRAIARQPFQRVVALAGRGELESRVRPHGFEHLVQRTRRHRRSRRAAARLLSIRPATRARAPRRCGRRRRVAAGQDRRGRLDRKAARAARRNGGTRAARSAPAADSSTRPSRSSSAGVRGDRAGPTVESSTSCVEPAEQILGRQHLHPRRRELEGERQRVEPPANRRHGRAVRRRSDESQAARRAPAPRTAAPRESAPDRRATSPPTPASSASGPTAYSRSPRTRSGARLVTSTRSDADRCQEIRDQRRRVQHLLEIVEHQQRRADRRTRRARAAASRSRVTSDSPSASAIADATNAGSRMAASGTNTTRVAPSAAIARASSSARRVFPTPPGPMSVMRRAAGSASQRRSVCTSASRPSSAVSGSGSETSLSSSTAASLSRRPRAPQERVAGRTGQIERRGQRAHGLDVGPPPFAALERAHRMDRQARNRRELFLREARRLAERFELRAE